MSRSPVGVLSVYFTLFDAQMPAGFREGRAAAADRLCDEIAREQDVVATGLVTSDEEGAAAGIALREAGVQAVVFAPSMAAPPSYALAALAELPDELPLVLWNAPGVDSLAGGLTQAQATVETTQVACVMLANPLVRAGRRFTVVSARPEDAAGLARLQRTLRGALAGRALHGAVALRVGDAIPGYDDVMASESQLAELGVREHAIDRAELEQAVAAVGDHEAASCLERLRDRGWTVETGGAQADASARLAIALESLASRTGAACGTVNCHGPLLRQNPAIGIPACLGASLLSAQGVPISCTGDQPTALTLMLARRMAGAALYCELYTPEASTGTMLVAAGGEGDPAWAADAVRVEPNVHYPGVCGHGLGLSFALSTGPATLLSLSPGGDQKGWRLAWATGEIVESRYDTMGGPNGMFRFDTDTADRAGEAWIASGATHHAALAPGRLDVEIEALARTAPVVAVRV